MTENTKSVVICPRCQKTSAPGRVRFHNRDCQPLKGLRADIYRSDYRSDLNRLDKVEQVTLVGVGIPEIFEVDEKAPAVRIGTIMGHEHVRPFEDAPEGMTGYMMGGSFVWTSDSRFPAKYPLPLYDRAETWELYELATR